MGGNWMTGQRWISLSIAVGDGAPVTLDQPATSERYEQLAGAVGSRVTYTIQRDDRPAEVITGTLANVRTLTEDERLAEVMSADDDDDLCAESALGDPEQET